MFGPKAMKGFFGGWHRPGFGHGPRRGRMFEKGDLKYVILDLLKDEPSHGYEVIRKLEERSRGFYSPSPGSVYPTLQLLEDMEYVSATQRDGKKVYAITDEGRKFLEENRRSVEAIWSRVGGGWDPQAAAELHEIKHDLIGLGKPRQPPHSRRERRHQQEGDDPDQEEGEEMEGGTGHKKQK